MRTKILSIIPCISCMVCPLPLNVKFSKYFNNFPTISTIRKLFLVIPFLMMMPGIKAQRIDLDKYWFNYSFRRLPNFVLDKSYMTYSVDISKTVTISIFANEPLTNRISIEGRKKVDQGGHFTVSINMDDLFINSADVKERVETTKDKNGKEFQTHYYHVEVVYTFAADARVTDYQGKILSNYTMSRRDENKVFSSAEYGSGKEAANYYNNNVVEIKTKLIRDQVYQALGSLNGSLNGDFGFMTKSYRDYLWCLGSKKHPDYQAFQDACLNAKNVLETITENQIPADVPAKLQSSMEFFNMIASKYNSTEEKGDAKFRYSAYFNLALINYILEQPEKAQEYANKLIVNDYDKGDGEKILKLVGNMVSDFEKHQTNTSHFVPDVEHAVPPGSN